MSQDWIWLICILIRRWLWLHCELFVSLIQLGKYSLEIGLGKHRSTHRIYIVCTKIILKFKNKFKSRKNAIVTSLFSPRFIYRRVPLISCHFTWLWCWHSHTRARLPVSVFVFKRITYTYSSYKRSIRHFYDFETEKEVIKVPKFCEYSAEI